MVKLGSKANPLILRVADESKAEQIAEICFEKDWQFVLGIEPDQEEDLTDLEIKPNLPLTERFREEPEPPQNATAMQAMRHRLQTREGEAVYAIRKSTVETVFGII